jgi:non-specific serine/threonine protein kinase
LAEVAEPQLRGPGQEQWLARLDVERDNLRVALQWAQERRAAEQGLRLATALSHFWLRRGHLSEGRRSLEALLAPVSGGEQPVSSAARLPALLWAATFATEQGDYGRAIALCEESEALCKEVGNNWGLAWLLNIRGELARHQGDLQAAAAPFEQSLALFRSLDDRWYLAMVLNNLGALARYAADNGRATVLYEESLAMLRVIGDTWSVAMILTNLGEVARDQGDLARALALCTESLELFRALGDPRSTAFALSHLGVVARARGEYAQAMALYTESLALWQQVGQRAEIAACLEGLAEALCALDQAAKAVRLLGAAAALRERIGAPVLPADRPDYERSISAARSALSAAFSPAWAAGQALPLDAAIALALEQPIRSD